MGQHHLQSVLGSTLGKIAMAGAFLICEKAGEYEMANVPGIQVAG